MAANQNKLLERELKKTANSFYVRCKMKTLSLAILLITHLFMGAVCDASVVAKGNLAFYVSKENVITVTLDFKISDEAPATYGIFMPFNIMKESIIHSENCLVAYYNMSSCSLLYISVLSTENNINIKFKKAGKVAMVGEHVMRAIINFDIKEKKKSLDILNKLINQIPLTTFSYNIDFDPHINDATTITMPNVKGYFSDIIRNDKKITIQYSNPKVGQRSRDILISQCLMALFAALVTISLTVFFVDLKKINISKKNKYSFYIITIMFISLNAASFIFIILGEWISILMPVTSFMTPHSISFAIMIRSLKKELSLHTDSEKRFILQSSSADKHQITFNYLPDTPMNHGWRLSIDGEQKNPPHFSVDSTCPISGSLQITHTDRYAMDYLADQTQSLANFAELYIKFSRSSAFYFRVKVSNRAGSKSASVWLCYEPGNFEAKLAYKNEWKLPMSGELLKNGWTACKISIADDVDKTFGKAGWIYQGLICIRLRGSLSLSPLTFYRIE